MGFTAGLGKAEFQKWLELMFATSSSSMAALLRQNIVQYLPGPTLKKDAMPPERPAGVLPPDPRPAAPPERPAVPLPLLLLL